jgi:hypothetical protein
VTGAGFPFFNLYCGLVILRGTRLIRDANSGHQGASLPARTVMAVLRRVPQNQFLPLGVADGRQSPRMTEVSVRSTAWLLLLSLFTCYLALAPGTTDGRGYVPEDRQATLDLLASFNAWVKGRPVPPVTWTRHGPVPLLLHIPFVKLGKSFISPDFMLSLEPVLLTSALLTILYIWLRDLSTPGMSLLLTLIAAFSTMLWPYAYIGLETSQSFFILLAGYLMLSSSTIRTWPRLLLVSLVCGLAISQKSTGIVLAPAIAWLVFVQFRADWRSRWRQTLAAPAIIAGIWGLSVIGWRFFWVPKGGGLNAIQRWLLDSPFQLFTNPIGIFASPSKGLFITAPVLLLGIYAIPRAWRTHRETTVFALLVTASMAAFISTLVVTADEAWGERYMHVAVAPLMVVIGAAWPRFEWKKHMALLFLGSVGLVISFLGAFYYYGERPMAAEAAKQNTMEWLSEDGVWNEIAFDARLFSVWWKGGTKPVLWTPAHLWAWSPPPGAMEWKSVNLPDYAEPQAFLIYSWKTRLTGSDLVVFRLCLMSLVSGPLLLLWVIARTVSARA